MSHRPNAPLIYTLGQIQFPRILDIEKACEKFFEKIKSIYKLDDVANFISYEAKVSDTGVSIDPIERKLWQYSDSNREWAFILSENSLSLHTNSYYNFEGFGEKFFFGLNALKETPEIGLDVIVRCGIRYVDLVIPPEGKTIADFLASWVLPENSPLKLAKVEEGAHFAKFKTEVGGELRFQAIRNPVTTMPYELQSEFLQKNKWQPDRPIVEFVMVDSDHIIMFDKPKVHSPAEIVDILKDLHLTTKEVFEKMGTPEANTYWDTKQ